jgi:LysR family glycine cleavage system transcriptional activator
MHRNLPPIQLLVTFEAVARTSSVRKAAAECFVTSSAISQQVKQLEDHLGVELLARDGRGVVVTRAGAAVADWARRVVFSFREGHADVLSQLGQPLVRLSVTDYVAYELLIPALHDFQTKNPGVELRLETSMSLVNFESEPIDAAIRFGVAPFPGLEARELGACDAVLVGAASGPLRPFRSADDLREHTLIYARDDKEDWERIASTLGLPRFRPKKQLFVDGYLASLRAAEAGLGIAICLMPMTASWIASGRLAALTPPAPTGHGNYFVFRAGSAKAAALDATYTWAKAQFERAATSVAPDALSPGATGRKRERSARRPARRGRTR